MLPEVPRICRRRERSQHGVAVHDSDHCEELIVLSQLHINDLYNVLFSLPHSKLLEDLSCSSLCLLYSPKPMLTQSDFSSFSDTVKVPKLYLLTPHSLDTHDFENPYFLAPSALFCRTENCGLASTGVVSSHPWGGGAGTCGLMTKGCIPPVIFRSGMCFYS